MSATDPRCSCPAGQHDQSCVFWPLQSVPMDPADLDRIPPVDIDVCDCCDGTGQIVDPGDRRDPASGDVWTCGMCGGSGDLSGTYWIGAAS